MNGIRWWKRIRGQADPDWWWSTTAAGTVPEGFWRRYAAGHPLLVHLNEENRGHGRRCASGIPLCGPKQGGLTYFRQTATGRPGRRSSKAFWNRRREYAMVIGWRSGRQDGCSRVIVTRVLRMVLRHLLPCVCEGCQYSVPPDGGRAAQGKSEADSGQRASLQTCCCQWLM